MVCDVAECASAGFAECFRLHEHGAEPARGVEDASFFAGEHVGEGARDGVYHRFNWLSLSMSIRSALPSIFSAAGID